MREILFKAKQKDWRDLPEESWWVEGYYAMMGKEDLFRHYIVQNCALTGLFEETEDNMYFNDVEIDPETLCQYTGLTDKNGEKIFIGDIIRCSKRCPHEVIWLNEYAGTYFGGMPAVYLSGLREGYAWTGSEEKMGNIFDNPELLKGDQGCGK